MRANRIELYVHLVWATWDRLPLITPQIEGSLYRCLGSEAKKMDCRVLAIGGMPDHVHVLTRIPATLPVSKLAQQLKGSSSHFVNHELVAQRSFKWMGVYGAFSVSRWDVKRVMAYINHQKQHHQANDLMTDLEDYLRFEDRRTG